MYLNKKILFLEELGRCFTTTLRSDHDFGRRLGGGGGLLLNIFVISTIFRDFGDFFKLLTRIQNLDFATPLEVRLKPISVSISHKSEIESMQT